MYRCMKNHWLDLHSSTFNVFLHLPFSEKCKGNFHVLHVQDGGGGGFVPGLIYILINRPTSRPEPMNHDVVILTENA